MCVSRLLCATPPDLEEALDELDELKAELAAKDKLIETLRNGEKMYRVKLGELDRRSREQVAKLDTMSKAQAEAEGSTGEVKIKVDSLERRCAKAEQDAKEAVERALKAERRQKRDAEEKARLERKVSRYSGHSADEGVQMELDYLNKQLRCPVNSHALFWEFRVDASVDTRQLWDSFIDVEWAILCGIVQKCQGLLWVAH